MSFPADSDEMNTEALVAALLDGDDAAGAFLVSRHAPLLLGYAAVIASDIPETDREMLCERSVERAVDRIDHFDPERGSLEGWLRGILRNEVKSWRRNTAAMDELDEDRLASQPTEVAPKAGRLNNTTEIIAVLLTELSETDQLIIRLRDLEEVPYSFIAQVLEVREDACRQRHKRALARLQILAASRGPLFLKLEDTTDD